VHHRRGFRPHRQPPGDGPQLDGQQLKGRIVPPPRGTSDVLVNTFPAVSVGGCDISAVVEPRGAAAAGPGRAPAGIKPPIHQAISDLGVGPNPWLLNVQLVLLGVLLTAFSAGLFMRLGPALGGGWRWVCTVLIGLPGLGYAWGGIFTEAPATVLLHWVGGQRADHPRHSDRLAADRTTPAAGGGGAGGFGLAPPSPPRPAPLARPPRP